MVCPPPQFQKKSEKKISFFANSLWSVPPFAGAFWGCKNVTYAQFSADYRPSCWTKALRLSHRTVKRIVDGFTFTLTVGGFATVNFHRQFDGGLHLTKNSPFHKLSNVFRTNRWVKQAERFRVHFWTFLFLTHSSSNFRLEEDLEYAIFRTCYAVARVLVFWWRILFRTGFFILFLGKVRCLCLILSQRDVVKSNKKFNSSVGKDAVHLRICFFLRIVQVEPRKKAGQTESDMQKTHCFPPKHPIFTVGNINKRRPF